MGLRRPQRIFAVVALLIAAAAVWLSIDTPRDSGVRLLGTIVYCKPRVTGFETPPTACVVAISGEDRRVQVYMGGEAPGRKVRLIEMRRAFTGRRYYIVDYSRKL